MSEERTLTSGCIEKGQPPQTTCSVVYMRIDMTYRWLTASRSKDTDRDQIDTAPSAITIPSPTHTRGPAGPKNGGPAVNTSHTSASDSPIPDDRSVDTADNVRTPIILSNGGAWQGLIQSSRVFDVFVLQPHQTAQCVRAIHISTSSTSTRCRLSSTVFPPTPTQCDMRPHQCLHAVAVPSLVRHNECKGC
jgi:hypothetical protein